MKGSMMAFLGFALLSVGTGCSAVSMQPAQEAKSTWETRVLADGVELRVNEDASPDALRVADDIQRDVRLRYPATETSTGSSRHWEMRVLADGVELLVSDNASADATRIADDIQSEMRARYISAR
jgi:hypothetical protein